MTQGTTAEYWDKVYEEGREFPAFSQILLDQILAKFPNAKSALDIGCGHGNLVTKLIDKNISATGIDLSSKVIKLAQTKEPRGEFQAINFADYTAKTFDLVFMKSVIAFIPDKLAAIKKANACIGKNGAFIVRTWVRFDDYTYDKGYTFRSVDYNETLGQLKQVFTSVEELDRSYSDDVDCNITWICTKTK